MTGIAIHDMDGNTLAFDLAELLAAVGAPALTSEWRVRSDPLQYIAEKDLPAFEMPGDRWLNGADFDRAASDVQQVIDGVFEGRRPGAQEPWITLRAIDSSWWEVYCDDGAVIDALKRRFRDVRDAKYDASTVF